MGKLTGSRVTWGQKGAVCLLRVRKPPGRDCESIVMCLGGASRFLGENVAAPTALDAALVISELSAIMGMIQGAHIVEEEGLDVGEYIEIVAGLLAANDGGELRRQGNAIVRNDFSETEAALGTWAAALSKFVEDHAKRGLNVELVHAISGLLNRASKAGFGEEEVAAVIKVMRDGVPPTS